MTCRLYQLVSRFSPACIYINSSIVPGSQSHRTRPLSLPSAPPPTQAFWTADPIRHSQKMIPPCSPVSRSSTTRHPPCPPPLNYAPLHPTASTAGLHDDLQLSIPSIDCFSRRLTPAHLFISYLLTPLSLAVYIPGTLSALAVISCHIGTAAHSHQDHFAHSHRLLHVTWSRCPLSATNICYLLGPLSCHIRCSFRLVPHDIMS